MRLCPSKRLAKRIVKSIFDFFYSFCQKIKKYKLNIATESVAKLNLMRPDTFDFIDPYLRPTWLEDSNIKLLFLIDSVANLFEIVGFPRNQIIWTLSLSLPPAPLPRPPRQKPQMSAPFRTELRFFFLSLSLSLALSSSSYFSFSQFI